MPDLAEPAICRFDNFLLNKQALTLCQLHADGHTTPIQIGSRALQVLCLLVDRRGEIASPSEIMDAVWANVAVEQNNLTVQVSALRRVLDADRGQTSCIQNIPGRGYRFLPTVTRVWTPLLHPAEETLAEDDRKAPCPGEPGDMSGNQSTIPVLDSAEGPTPAIVERSSIRPWRGHRALLAASCLCVAALLASAMWYVGRTPPSQADHTTAPAASTPAVVASAEGRPRLSLVVLPFINLGGENVDDATVDALTEDLTSDLARVYDLFVIGRSSAFSYKGKPIDIKRVGEELGVRYVVEGSVRKLDGTLRVNAQLVSTETGSQVWSDHFGVERDGIGFSIDDLVRQIAHVLNDRVIDSESIRSARERPVNPDVTDILLRAGALENIPPNPQLRSQLISLYERALELDPSSAMALAHLAVTLADSTSIYTDPAAPQKYRRAEELVQRAEQLRPYEMWVMFARLNLLINQHRCADVMPAARRLIAVYPNVTSSHMYLGICLTYDGRAAEAIPEYEQTIRLDPRNAQIHSRYRLIGYALLFLERYEEAVLWLQKSLASHPNDSPRNLGNIRAAIAAAQALADRTQEARASAAEAVRLWPTLTARGYYPLKNPNPLIAAQVARVRDGLRLAGIRDHADEDADPGVPADDVLHTNYESPTPTSAPGARTIRTPDLATLLEQRKPLVLDTLPWGKSIPGAIGLWGAGVGGSMSDEYQERLGQKMQQLTRGDRNAPVVAMGSNAERFQGRNLALRLVALGYTETYWYRGGREAWEAAGLPTTDLVVQDW